MSELSDLGRAAVWYGQHGFPVFPLRPRDKDPLTKHGFQDASKDTGTITAWWQQWPAANIGLPTGTASGLLAIDVDPRHGGDSSLESLIHQHGRYPDTAEQVTGGGGRHILFRHPAGTRSGTLADGIDVKGEGGYVVLSPSVHPSGNRYSWDGSEAQNALLHPADPPAWLLPANGARTGPAPPVPEKIPHGSQHHTLVSFAGTMRNAGANYPEIRAALLEMNRNRCEKPGAEKNIEQIARSICNYSPGKLYLGADETGAADTVQPGPEERAARRFDVLHDNRYRWTLPDIGAVFDIDRLRRQREELIGELCVRCQLPGARAVNGDVLTIADLNISSARARSERARLLAERARTKGVDWAALVEEFSQKVLEADRAGLPAVDLRDLPRPDAEQDCLTVEGLVLPRRHPSVLFGDGGTAKSYTALYLAGRMAETGLSVALFDWELAGEDHRDRLERLFSDGMPRVLYARCERPLVYEVDRLARIVQDNRIEYTIYDSVAFACDGPPEAAEVAGRYFRAARQIGGGSLHVAHISKAEGADKKPFGSTFWHNGSRATWFVKLDEETADGDVLSVGFFNRKANLGRLSPAVGFTITFTEDRTVFRRTEVADSPDLAGQLSVRKRVTHLLRRGPLTVTQIAEELGIEVNTVTQTINRYVKKGQVFIVLDGQNTNRKIGLLERDTLS